MGCKRSFGLLYEMYCQRLRSLIRTQMGPVVRAWTEVDDVEQETWRRAYESLSEFECHNEGAFFQWLGGISEHVIQNEARRRKPVGPGLYLGNGNGNGTGKQFLEELLIASAVSPSSVMARNERFERLVAALHELSDDYRQVILLARVRCLPMKEIAQRMHRSEDAAGMLLLRALRRFRKLFGDTGSFRLPDGSIEVLENLVAPTRDRGQSLGGESRRESRNEQAPPTDPPQGESFPDGKEPTGGPESPGPG